MLDIIKFQKWLKEEKDIDISSYVKEYKTTKYLTKEDIFLYLASLFDLSIYDILKPPKKARDRGGNNFIPTARGMLVKWVLLNHNKNVFSSTNVYYKIFGFHIDHSTALYFKNKEYINKEQKIYNKLKAYLESQEIKWEL